MHPRTGTMQCRSMLRTLRSTARAPGIAPHGNGFLVLLDIGEVGERALQLPAIDRLGRFACVFEGYAQVGAAGARGFGGFELSGCVADLCKRVVLVLVVDWSGYGARSAVVAGACVLLAQQLIAKWYIHTILAVVARRSW